MKKFLGTLTVLLMTVSVHAQVTVKGIVTNKEQKPLQGAIVQLTILNKKLTMLTNSSGYFELDKVTLTQKAYLRVNYVGKKTVEQTIEPNADSASLYIVLEDLAYFLEPLEVKAVRASSRSPFTKTDLEKFQVEKNNLGQDLPFLLDQTPSVVVNSDAGNGVGYTAMRIRGTDATRINVTLNGIPYNDAESQGTYFVDLPDFASSVHSIQIQRGVGTSTNGSGAFGATINVRTNELIEKPYGELNNSYGSFNTWKNTIRTGTGLLNNHFTIDARLSRISSDGYIDRASSNLQSFYFSTAYINNKTSLRLNVISGKEKTYQAWYGIDESILPTNRTFNPAGTEKPGIPYNNQTDNYLQTHYQLFFNQAISEDLSLNIATFLTRGKGYYEEYKADQTYADYGLTNFIAGTDTVTTTDLIRQRWLDNYFYGQTFALQYKKSNDEITFGGSWSKYDGDHFGNVIWANAAIPKDHEYYRYPALKTDFNFYAKWLHELKNNFNFFGDMQFRQVSHTMNGFEGNPLLNIKKSFNFLNPKTGISYVHNGWNAYLSYALAGKEPNRDDFQASNLQQPKPEILHDFEAGIHQKTAHYTYGATLYYMLYKNQLVLTGKVNDVGAFTRVNVPNSYRAGIELEGGVVITSWLHATANASFSQNKIQSFTEYLTEYDDDLGTQNAIEHHNTNIAFSPSIITSGTITTLPVKNLELSFTGKYVGRQYLDNTQDKIRSLHAYYTQQVKADYTIKHFLFSDWKIIAQVNNLFNTKYEPNGATYPYMYGGHLVNDNYYYPMAGINFMFAIQVKL